MLRLYILRHAKSSWALPGVTDFNRGLNDRGNNDLGKIASMMCARNYFPDHIYCSAATRTSLTIEGIKADIQEQMGNSGSIPEMPIEFSDSLYSGTVDNYLNHVKSHGNDSASVMIVGHNPTCHSLTSLLCKDGAEGTMEDLAYNFPTGALAVIDFQSVKWSDLQQKSGYLLDFVLPRQLPDRS